MIKTLLLSAALISTGIAADDFEREKKEIAKFLSKEIGGKQETMETHLSEDLIPAIGRNYQGHPETIASLSKRYIKETYDHLTSMQYDLIERLATSGKISERAFNEVNDSPPTIAINYSWEEGRLRYIGARPRFSDSGDFRISDR